MQALKPLLLSPRAEKLTIVVLLVVYAALAFAASLHKGASFDEGEQLAGGYNIWLNRDFRMEGANGDLIKRWATLPYLVTRPNPVSRDNPRWRAGYAYEVGYDFLFNAGNRPETLLAQGRAMVVLLGLATGGMIYWLSRRIFGVAGGLVSLVLFVFSPNMLAFGGIVSTEMTMALTLTATTWCVWRLLRVVSLGRVLVSLGAFGLLLLAKPTALVIFPMAAILVVVSFFVGEPVYLRWRGSEWTVRSAQARAGLVAGLMLLHALAGWAVIWAHYDFRYAASPVPSDPTITLYVPPDRDPVDPRVETFIGWCRQEHIFPEGFLAGIDMLLGENDHVLAFLDGEWKVGGWRTFFPRAMILKTAPAIWTVLALAVFCAWRAKSKPSPAGAGAPLAPVWLDTIPFIVLAVVYLTVAMTQHLNIGHRHALPMYPALFVLAGAAGLAWARRWRVLAATVSLSLGWLAVEVVAIYPYFLGYFSPLAGGPRNGYRHLVDSSLGWGMNLPAFKHWLDEHNPGDREPVYLAYFGTDSPDYHGIKARRLPGFPDWREHKAYPLTPGYYAISASLLQSVYTRSWGPWNRDYESSYQLALSNIILFDQTAADPAKRAALLAKYPPEIWTREITLYEDLRFARLCAWLRRKGGPPQDQAGYSICIWKLDAAQLDNALLGPPPELADKALDHLEEAKKK